MSKSRPPRGQTPIRAESVNKRRKQEPQYKQEQRIQSPVEVSWIVLIAELPDGY